LAIEYCMGTLQDLVCGGYGDDFAMTEQSHLPVIRQITAGLNQLHSLGIVHGNLKPSNILVSFPKGDTKEPMMKLADFGISSIVRDEANRLTQFRLVTTEGWMCPTDTQDPISPSFDIFALACLFVFVATNGFHAFGTGVTNQRPVGSILDQMNSALVKNAYFLNLVARMSNFNAALRPTANDVLNHPIFTQPLSVIFGQDDVTEPLTSPSPSF